MPIIDLVLLMICNEIYMFLSIKNIIRGFYSNHIVTLIMNCKCPGDACVYFAVILLRQEIHYT